MMATKSTSRRKKGAFVFCVSLCFLWPSVLPMLAVTDLKKSFVSPDGERVEIVNVPSFALAAGEQLALRGESGSGKTTFLNLIAGILAADSGKVMVDAVEMSALAEPRRDRLRAEK